VSKTSIEHTSVLAYKFSPAMPDPGIMYTKRLFITIAVVFDIGYDKDAIGNQVFVSVSNASQRLVAKLSAI
jgi:hypothetical protein